MNLYYWLSFVCAVAGIYLLTKEYVADKLQDPDCWLNRPRCRCCGRKTQFIDYSHPSGTRWYWCVHDDCARQHKEVSHCHLR